MNYRAYTPDDTLAIELLYTEVFTESETEVEGLLIGNLAKDLIAGAEEGDLFGFVGVEGDLLVAAILFSRLTFPTTESAFLLAPVAVHTDYQGRGIGQRLISYGLSVLRREGVEFVVTYGSPCFYSQVGFHAVSQEVVIPPFTLSQPEGWLGQALQSDSIKSLRGRCSCVPAFNNPVYW